MEKVIEVNIPEITSDENREYRIVGLTMFVISIALLIMRIFSYYMQIWTMNNSMDPARYYLLLDAIFSVPVQLGLLLLFPFLMYKFALKKNMRDMAAFSGYRKCDVRIILLSFTLGLIIIFLTMFVSSLWAMLLSLFGYDISGGSDEIPLVFNAGYFVLTVIMTAILPCICEEFTNRGGLLTALRSRYSKGKTILLIGIAFGLFHQNITQVFYAALLGALLAFLVLETQSIYPAMIVHFMNNFMSILLDNSTTYGWPVLGGFYDFIQSAPASVVMSSLALIILAAYGILFAIVKLARAKRSKDLYLELYRKEPRPTFRDNTFFIGAIVVTVASTLLTFAFGL